MPDLVAGFKKDWTCTTKKKLSTACCIADQHRAEIGRWQKETMHQLWRL